ncbi:MAG TPA: vitamin K epoxide reductase family protein [Symbiobacteriaceae bacterium]|nr:vitamin K epoxide reductase family protein [Symbiobacteriaceae bacterium]
MSLRRTLQITTLLGVVGLGISLYLTWVYMAGGIIPCGGSGGCATVQHSAYAWVGGVPVPMLGTIAYSLLIALAILALQFEGRRELFLLALVAGSVIGVLFSGFLTYVEFFVIHAVCRWCIASAVVTVLLLGFAIGAWRQYQNE